MQHILRISGNYADEFDVSGLHEISAEQAAFLVLTQGACFSSTEEIYFGTNEGVQVNELSVELDSIDEEDYQAVLRVFKLRRLSIGMIDLSDFIDEAMNPEE